MKKLMIAAAIVCAAAMSQAATCYWNFQSTTSTYTYIADSSTKLGTTESPATAYLFKYVADTMTQQTVLDDYLKNKTSLSSMSYAKTADLIDGKITKASFTTEGTGSDTFQWFMAVVNDDTGDIFISKNVTGMEQTSQSGRNLNFNNNSASGAKAITDGKVIANGGWYTQAVPEPTSGLLLLLGVAGLALRRRRA